MNKGSIVERLCSDLIAKNRDINGLLYFYFFIYQSISKSHNWQFSQWTIPNNNTSKIDLNYAKQAHVITYNIITIINNNWNLFSASLQVAMQLLYGETNALIQLHDVEISHLFPQFVSQQVADEVWSDIMLTLNQHSQFICLQPIQHQVIQHTTLYTPTIRLHDTQEVKYNIFCNNKFQWGNIVRTAL